MSALNPPRATTTSRRGVSHILPPPPPPSYMIAGPPLSSFLCTAFPDLHCSIHLSPSYLVPAPPTLPMSSSLQSFQLHSPLHSPLGPRRTSIPLFPPSHHLSGPVSVCPIDPSLQLRPVGIRNQPPNPLNGENRALRQKIKWKSFFRRIFAQNPRFFLSIPSYQHYK